MRLGWLRCTGGREGRPQLTPNWSQQFTKTSIIIQVVSADNTALQLTVSRQKFLEIFK